MKHFPEPVELTDTIRETRENRSKALIRFSIYGIIARIGIIGMEVAGVVLYGSSSLLMDAIATGLDVIASILLIICIFIASKPPDENHPFGHGRIEPLAGLQMGIFLIATSLGALLMQIFEFSSFKHEQPIAGFLWLIPLAAVILLELIYRLLRRTAKKFDSPALAADASHFRIDSLSSLFALIALFLGALFPSISHIFDHAGAFAIIGAMFIMGFLASRENMHQLVDRVPSSDLFMKVRNAAKRVKGVLETEKIRIQLYGPDAHVDIDIEVDPELSVEKAHKISQKTRAAIQEDWPFVRDVTVHIEPFYPNDH